MKSKRNNEENGKIKKNNLLFLISVYFMKIVVLMAFLADNYHISPYYNTYKFINILNVELSFDLLYILIILLWAEFQGKKKNIFRIYQKDSNYRLQKFFIVPELLKTLFLCKIIGNSLFYYHKTYIVLFSIIAGITFLYYILTFLIFSEERMALRYKFLRKALKKFKKRSILKSNVCFILIKGDKTPSSFDINKIQKHDIEKSHVYIKEEEWKGLEEKEQLFIVKNLIAVIYEDEKAKMVNQILQEDFEKVGYYKIIATNKKEEYEKRIDDTYQHFYKICDMESVIEFTENLLMISSDVMVNPFQYCLMKFLVWLELHNKRVYPKSKNVKEIIDINSFSKKLYSKMLERDMKNRFSIICQKDFNSRFQNEQLEVPQDLFLKSLFRNAYTNSSPYQSSMMLFNYITAIGRIIECYLIGKNREDINLNQYREVLAKDNTSVWRGQITLNIYDNIDNYLYPFLREKELELTLDEKNILKLYLADVLNCEMQGEKITYDVLSELYQEFRNKVEAHGIISDDNVYIVWKIAAFLASAFNRFFNISKLKLEYRLPNSKIEIGYADEKKVSLGIYMIVKNNLIYFLKEKQGDKLYYYNYFNGNEEIEELEK